MVFYECVRCGYVATEEEWARGEPKLETWEIQELEKRRLSTIGGHFKCPNCNFKVAKKLRPPIAKRTKAV